MSISKSWLKFKIEFVSVPYVCSLLNIKDHQSLVKADSDTSDQFGNSNSTEIVEETISEAHSEEEEKTISRSKKFSKKQMEFESRSFNEPKNESSPTQQREVENSTKANVLVIVTSTMSPTETTIVNNVDENPAVRIGEIVDMQTTTIQPHSANSGDTETNLRSGFGTEKTTSVTLDVSTVTQSNVDKVQVTVTEKISGVTTMKNDAETTTLLVE